MVFPGLISWRQAGQICCYRAFLNRSTSALLKRNLASVASQSDKMSNHNSLFEEHEVVPDVIPTSPMDVMHVKYASGVEACLGNELKPRQVKDQPSDIKWKAEEKEYYTLCLTDPDAPSRADPKFREWHHWLVVNIPGNKIDKGQVLSEYVGSGPPQGTGNHRYVFVAYKQPGKIAPTEKHLTNHSGDGRGKFKIQAFAEKYKLGNPVAGNFYLAQWDDYVPELYKQLGG